jgi:hypothetical protein
MGSEGGNSGAGLRRIQILHMLFVFGGGWRPKTENLNGTGVNKKLKRGSPQVFR